MSKISLLNDDCFLAKTTIQSNSVDLILTDIPYVVSVANNFTTMKDRQGRKGIDFGKWDKQFEVARLALFVPKYPHK